jgi:predicted nucleotide-binding protein
MSDAPRPVVFLGSSKEGLPLLEAAQVLLEEDCELIPWTTMVGASDFPLLALLDQLEQFEFAILLLTPDDVAISRKRRQQAPRDNLIFEVGLLMGRLGRKCVFMVADRATQQKLPSDWQGLTLVTFHQPTAGTLEAALGPACARIKRAISDHRRRSEKAVVDLSVRF